MHSALHHSLAFALTTSIAAAGLAAPPNQDPAFERPAPHDAPHAVGIDPLALGLIERVGEHIDRVSSLSARIEYSFEMRGPDSEATQKAAHELALKKPNLMRLELVEGEPGETIVSDGESMYIFQPQRNRYLKQDAPEGVRGLMRHPRTTVGTPGGFGGPLSFLGMFLVPELFDELRPMLRSASHRETQIIDGSTVHKITLAVAFPTEPPAGPEGVAHREPVTEDAGPQVMPEGTPRTPPMQPAPRKVPELTLDLWIEEHDDNAILRRMRIDLARLLAGHEAAPAGLDGHSIDIWITMREWEFDIEFPDEKFTFTPPENAEQVDSLRDMTVVGAADPATHPLLGERAPTFQLQRLIGTGLDLDEHLGRDIIILDFWATWCTPCIRAMPHLISVAEHFSDRNVVFFAVNLREDFDRVQQFVEDRGWQDRLKVPMDIDGEVGRLYHVSSIPQTVLIDREGIVQRVHIGFSGDLEERLREEVQTLLDGGSLLDRQPDEAEEEEPDDE